MFHIISASGGSNCLVSLAQSDQASPHYCLPRRPSLRSRDCVSSFLSNALSYAQSLGIFGAGFLVIWAVANIARERPAASNGLVLAARCSCHRFCNFFEHSRLICGTSTQNPLPRSLSVRAEFFGLELEDWGLVLAWAIVMRLLGETSIVCSSFLPVSTVMTYGSAAILVVLIPMGEHGKPRDTWSRGFSTIPPKGHKCALRCSRVSLLIEDER